MDFVEGRNCKLNDLVLVLGVVATVLLRWQELRLTSTTSLDCAPGISIPWFEGIVDPKRCILSFIIKALPLVEQIQWVSVMESLLNRGIHYKGTIRDRIWCFKAMQLNKFQSELVFKDVLNQWVIRAVTVIAGIKITEFGFF